MQSDASRGGLFILILVTVAVRVGVLALDWGSFSGDEDAYGRLAVNWATTGHYTFSDAPERDGSGTLAQPNEASGGPSKTASDDELVRPPKPTAYRPPMYPWMLSSAVINRQLNHFGVAAMHVWLGLATVLLVYMIGVRLRMRWPIVPALAVACDPILLRGSQLLMTETLVTFFAVSAWLLMLMLIRPRLSEVGTKVFGLRLSTRLAALLGAMLGMAVLTRPTMLPWAVASMLMLCARRSESGNRVTLLTTALLFFLFLLAPWTYRNERAFGKPIVTTTHGGYTLLLANNPLIYEHFRKRGPDRNWKAQAFHDRWALRHEGDPTEARFWKSVSQTSSPSATASETQGTNRSDASPTDALDYPVAPDIEELSDDQLAQQSAMATIKRDPVMFAVSCLYRVGWLWAVYPQGDLSQDQRISIGIWYSIWFAMALLGLMWFGSACRSRVWMVPLLLVLTLTAIHAVYWSNMRMRAPLMPVVYIIACWPLMRIRIPLPANGF